MHLVISRTDAIGDVCLTLPTVGWLKSRFPHWHITMLVNAYSAPVAQSCQWVDTVAVLPATSDDASLSDWLKSMQADQIVHVFPNRAIAMAAKRAAIAKRSGVWGRPYHWLYCNDFVWMSRARSNLHEAQLNMLLLARVLNLPCPTEADLKTHWVSWSGLGKHPSAHTVTGQDILLHPYSRGNGREWPTPYFAELAHLLVMHGWRPVICGTSADATVFEDYQVLFPKETFYALGQDDLMAYMHRISHCRGLVASGTGPLHVASAFGRVTIGLFPPRQGINKKRWGALGPASFNIQGDSVCRKTCSNRDCACMREIQPSDVWTTLQRQLNASDHTNPSW